MLPLLKENIKRTELSYFVKELMPLAKKLRAKAEFFASQGQPIQAKIFENLQNQVLSRALITTIINISLCLLLNHSSFGLCCLDFVISLPIFPRASDTWLKP